jgi:hypothetical protein
MQNSYGKLPVSILFLPYGSMLTHGSIWNGKNILRQYVKKDNLGKPLEYQPYVTSN